MTDLYGIGVFLLYAGMLSFCGGFLVMVFFGEGAHYGSETPLSIGAAAALICILLDMLIAIYITGWWFCWPVAAVWAWLTWAVAWSIPEAMQSYRRRSRDR